jgi:hypothetical protein
MQNRRDSGFRRFALTDCVSTGSAKWAWAGAVWAYFVNPAAPDGSWSDEPIEVQLPPDGGDTVPVVARPFHWATNPDVPRSGYFARVSSSVVSADAARVPVKERT